MNQYVTGATIKALRTAQKMTQSELAARLGVSDKAVSKWETGKGFPDITLLEPIAQTLHSSVIELLSGENIVNSNTCGNLLRSQIYVCPVCGNVIRSVGNAVVICCGITLPALEPEEIDSAHNVIIEHIEDEMYVTVDHCMTKEHYISFIACVTGDKFEFVKLYPEGAASARFKIRRTGTLYFYCNKHGLMKTKIK